MVSRMREKGQITIPADIRQSLHLEKDAPLSIALVGNGILITPAPSVFESVSGKYSKAAEKAGITLDELLEDLKKNRQKNG